MHGQTDFSFKGSAYIGEIDAISARDAVGRDLSDYAADSLHIYFTMGLWPCIVLLVKSACAFCCLENIQFMCSY